MEAVAKQLGEMGHEVGLPPVRFVDGDGREWETQEYYKFKKSQPFKNQEFLKNHSQRIRDHFNKVEWGQAILVTNYHKNGIAAYIGPNTLMEMGLAFHLGKKIYLLNPIPETAWKEEILGMEPVVINNNLNSIV